MRIKGIVHQCRIKFLKWLKKNQWLIPRNRLGFDKMDAMTIAEEIQKRIEISQTKVERYYEEYLSANERYEDYVEAY